MRRIALASGLLLVVVGARISAETHTFKIEPARSAIHFEIRHFLGKVVGRFGDVHGTIRLDKDNPENSSVVATCAVRTIDTANGTRDTHLRSELFEVEKYSEATFRSRKVVRTGSSNGDVTGDLTLHGVTQSFVLHVTLLQESKTAEGDQVSRWRVRSDPLSRRAFGLTFSRGIEAVSGIGDQVVLKIECEAISAD